jgi:hypothetical protein
MDWIKNNILTIKEVFFYIICWISGAISILIGVNHIDFAQPDKIDRLFLIFLAIGLLLILLPFFKKVKIGTVELEREVQQTKKEISDLRTEVRQQISILSTNMNTIGNLSNQVNLYLPAAQDIKNATIEVKERLGDKSKEVEEISDELILPYEDKVMSLAQTRIRIEYLLRSILQKRLTFKSTGKPVKFLTLSALTREFYNEFPQYRYMTQSFDYVNKISTAAIHALNVEDKQVTEVLQLGATLIATLDEINSK